ncbi:MAG: glycosyltransferase family 4 protein [Prevotellaceae bacterium]|nr:glycosyltransferase family 4 protein [Prevotellaceae bacterium]
MPTKLCLVINVASLYREAIYKLIDREYDCEWLFGDDCGGVKEMDLALLKRASKRKTLRLPRTPFYIIRGAASSLRRKGFGCYVATGDLFCLSVWCMLLTKRLLCRKKRIYLWTHGWYGKETRMRRTLKKLFFKSADGIFLYGNHARSLMIKEGFDPEKLFVIHNSLDHDTQLRLRDTLSPSDIIKKHFCNDDKTLIFIGRLTQVKRLDTLIEAVRLLRERGRNFNLVLIGDGEKRGELAELAKKCGLERRIWFYGSCFDEKENAELLYNADLCVSPGNVGLTAMHAMMFGVPVITHNDFPHQMPEFEAIHPGITGDFFEYGSTESLAEKISTWLISHDTDRESVRQACYNEIDTQWTPEFQIKVLKEHIV